MVTGVYGNLHEASMSDFLDLLVECRDFLSDLTALLDALHSIDTDELVARIEHSVLPDGAATAAAQATQLAALQKIDDLQHALESIALDRLLVRGMDQIFTFKGVLSVLRSAAVSGANGYVDSQPCAAGEIWVVTNTYAFDHTNATTAHDYTLLHDAVSLSFDIKYSAFAANERSSSKGLVFLDPADAVRVYFTGSQIGDTCYIVLTGYIMTLET